MFLRNITSSAKEIHISRSSNVTKYIFNRFLFSKRSLNKKLLNIYLIKVNERDNSLFYFNIDGVFHAFKNFFHVIYVVVILLVHFQSKCTDFVMSIDQLIVSKFQK